jgi:hypothetical protein
MRRALWIAMLAAALVLVGHRAGYQQAQREHHSQAVRR